VGGVGFVHTTTVRLPSRTKRLFSIAGFGLNMICTGSTDSPLGEKVHVSRPEKETELFKASEVLKNAASISRELFHVEHSES
jgi:hypothetical protein